LKLRSRLLIYLDLAAAILLSFIFYDLVFNLPIEFFPSPLQAAYSKLSASILLGLCIGLFVLLLTEVVFRLHRGVRLSLLKSVRRHVSRRALAVQPVKPKVKPVSRAISTSFISKHKHLRGFAGKIGLSVARDVLEAGETLSPYRFAAENLFYALVAFFILVPVGVALALLVHPALIAVMAAPALPLVYPKLKLRSAVGDRRRGLEDEVPFFTVYASILQSVGISLYNSLLSTVGRSVFRQVEKDALMCKRNVEFFFKSPAEALEELGRIHPNEKMKTLLLGYTSEWRSGGNMASYLESKAEDYLNDMSFRWRSYAERATDIGEMVISLLFVFPMMILMSAFIFPSQAITMTSLVLSLAIPLLTVIVFGAINATQPKTYNIISGNLNLSLAIGASSFALAYIIRTPAWLCVATGLASASAIYGATVLLHMREIDMLEKALPRFMRDVTEYKKMGYDINRAIIKIAEENVYNVAFDSLLKAVTRQLDLGVRMAEVKVPTRSWLSRMSFFLLAEVVESGGGTSKCLETLTYFVNHVVRVKHETRASMRLYQFLSVFTPIGLSFVTALMFTLLSAFSATLALGAEAGILGEIAQVPQQLMDMCYILVVTASTCVALLSTKAVDLTAKNTLWITVNLALAAAGIAFSTQIASLLMKVTLGI
jgi:flagellar protein FlaJ